MKQTHTGDVTFRIDVNPEDVVPIINAAGNQAVRVVHAIGVLYIAKVLFGR